MKVIIYIILLSFLTGCVAFTPNNNSANVVFISTSNPPYLLYAASYVGLNERNDRDLIRQLTGVDPVRTEWCAAFTNAILSQNNIEGSDSVSDNPLMARSFLEWGESVSEPQRGDIVVFRRGNSGWQGHVAFYLGTVERDGRTYYRVLGGNQNNSINVSEYPIEIVLGIRRIENPPRLWKVSRTDSN